MTPEIEQLKGELANLSARISMAEAQIAVIDDDIAEPDLGSYDGDSGKSQYLSFFRVIDASVGGACKVGVTNGSAAMLSPVGNCGAVKINGVRVDVAATSETLTVAGDYHIWLHMWIDASAGESAEIIVGAVDDDDPPDNPNGGVAFSSQLVGRITVEVDGGDAEIISITQDYLRGGEHFEFLWGDCDGKEIQVTP